VSSSGGATATGHVAPTRIPIHVGDPRLCRGGSPSLAAPGVTNSGSLNPELERQRRSILSHSQTDPVCASVANARVHYVFDGECHEGMLIRLTIEGFLVDTATPPPVGSVIAIVLARGGGFSMPRALAASVQDDHAEARTAIVDSGFAVGLCLSATVFWRWHLAFAARWGPLAPTQVRGLDAFMVALSRSAPGSEDYDEESLC